MRMEIISHSNWNTVEAPFEQKADRCKKKLFENLVSRGGGILAALGTTGCMVGMNPAGVAEGKFAVFADGMTKTVKMVDTETGKSMGENAVKEVHVEKVTQREMVETPHLAAALEYYGKSEKVVLRIAVKKFDTQHPPGEYIRGYAAQDTTIKILGIKVDQHTGKMAPQISSDKLDYSYSEVSYLFSAKKNMDIIIEDDNDEVYGKLINAAQRNSTSAGVKELKGSSTGLQFTLQKNATPQTFMKLFNPENSGLLQWNATTKTIQQGPTWDQNADAFPR